MFWVYILQNPVGKFYIGQTEDLCKRVAEHNAPGRDGVKFTAKGNGQWRLVWSESYASREEAMRREKQIKSMKSARWIRETLLHESARSVLYSNRITL
jgi:putative endonuclease